MMDTAQKSLETVPDRDYWLQMVGPVATLISRKRGFNERVIEHLAQQGITVTSQEVHNVRRGANRSNRVIAKAINEVAQKV